MINCFPPPLFSLSFSNSTLLLSFPFFQLEDTAKIQPYIQILGPISEIKGTGSSSSTGSRYRLTISDGTSSVNALATSKFATMLNNQQVKPYSIVKVKDYLTNFVTSRKLPILNEVEIVSSLSYQIGQPNPVSTAPPDASSAAQPTHEVPAAAPFGAASGAWGQQQQQQQQQQHQPPSSSSNPYGSPVVRTNSNAVSHLTIPISGLSPYVSRWTIKVRVTSKSDIRQYNNQKGPGSMFKMELLDEQGSEIGATFFNSAVSKFYENLVVGSLYYMSGGRVKVADPKYSKFQYEITFDDKSTFQQITGDDASIANPKLNFVPLARLQQMDKDTVVDILAVVHDVKEMEEKQSKAGKAFKKRELTLMDNSGDNLTAVTIDITLWDAKATAEYKVGSVLSIKGAKLGDWNTKTLSGGSQIVTNPKMEEADSLLGWYTLEGKGQPPTSLSERTGGRGGGGGIASLPAETDLTLRFTVSSLKGDGGSPENLGIDGSALFLVKAGIKFIKSDVDKIAYPACTVNRDGRLCNKKADRNQNAGGGSYDSWTCSNCGPQSVVDWRYMLSTIIFDQSGENFVTLFNAESEGLLGMKAESLMQLGGYNTETGTVKDDTVSANYDRTFREHFFSQALFTVKVKADTGRDSESRITLTVVKMKPLVGPVLVTECKALITNIEKYLKM